MSPLWARLSSRRSASGPGIPGDAPARCPRRLCRCRCRCRHGRPWHGRHAGCPAPRRARDPWKVAFFAVMIVAILAAAAWALLGSSLLTVRSVRVTGTRLVPEAAVLRAAAIRPRIPLIRIDTAQVARQVEQLTEVQSAQVSRDWPNTVVISVRERTPALAIAQQGSFELVDEFGVVVRSTA